MVDITGVRGAAAARTHETLLKAAAAEFVLRGVNAPVRDIATRAGVGVGTLYRHFPNRAELVTAVYRHQVDECAAHAAALLLESTPPSEALTEWIDAFVEFVVTKHGLGVALLSEDPSLIGLHDLMLDKLVPACASLIEASARAGEIDTGLTAYTLMRAVGNLCIVGPGYDLTDAKEMVRRLLEGWKRTPNREPHA